MQADGIPRILGRHYKKFKKKQKTTKLSSLHGKGRQIAVS